MNNPIKVLVAGNSASLRESLIKVLAYDPGIRVLGTASSKKEAIESVERFRPDVIAMDIHMPVETTREIMETYPTPIVIVSGNQKWQDISYAMHAMEAGALAIVQRPDGRHEEEELIHAIKLMSEVKVVKRRQTNETALPSEFEERGEIRLIAMGASIGGPPVIQTILSRLPKDISVPILIVQHMSAGFIEGFVGWLDETSILPVHVALNGSYIHPGNVYVAPEGVQMKVDISGRIWLTKDGPENGLLPSVSYLFRSVAETFGKNSVGILLTGMGRDGAAELKLMKEKGAITIAQDSESSIIGGMPGAAVSLGAAMFVLSPEAIADLLINLINKNRE